MSGDPQKSQRAMLEESLAQLRLISGDVGSLTHLRLQQETQLARVDSELSRLNARCAKQDEQIDRLIKFCFRMLHDMESFGKSLEEANFMQRRVRGPFNSRRNDR